jgi:hypothetical protein
MFANRKHSGALAVAGVLAAAGGALLWLGGNDDAGRVTTAGAQAALLGPVAADAELTVQLVVRGQLPTFVPAAGTAQPLAAGWGVAAGDGAGPQRAGESGPIAGPYGEPDVAAVGTRSAAPAAARPGGPGATGGRLREGRSPAPRAAEPGAGSISDRTLRSILGRKRGSLEACYHGARALDPTLEGGVTFALTVKQAGDVEVEVVDRSPALDQAGVTSCIREKLEALDFHSTPPQGGELHLRLPMNFLQVPESDSDA